MENNTDSNVKKGVTAIIYDEMHKPFFLVLKRRLGWEGWEFVKGAINTGESEIDAVKREVIEETGLQKFKIVKKLEGVTKEFTDQQKILNVYSVYLIEASMNIPIQLPVGESAEHSTYLWTDAESALSKLTWENDKDLLMKVIEQLKTNS